jgi:hypothetical protein
MQPLFKNPTADVGTARHRTASLLVLALYEMWGLLFTPFAAPHRVFGDICDVAARRFKQSKRLFRAMHELKVPFDLWSAHVQVALGSCGSTGASGLPLIPAGCYAGGGMALYLHPVSEGLIVHLVAPSRYLVENLSDNLQVRIVPGLAHDVLRQVAFFFGMPHASFHASVVSLWLHLHLRRDPSRLAEYHGARSYQSWWVTSERSLCAC